MKSLMSSKPFSIFFVLCCIVIFPLILGCGGSDDALKKQPSDNALPETKEQEYRNQITRINSSMDSIKNQNIKLKEELQKAQQENSNLNIRLGEAQKGLNDQLPNTAENKLVNENKTPDENKTIEDKKQVYDKALKLFRSKKYNESLAKFQKIFMDDPTGELAPNALYWVGESYFGMKNYKQSILAFEQVLSGYSGSKKSDAALIMMGKSYLKLNDKKNAKETFEKLQQMFPESPYLAKIPVEFKVK